MDITIGEIEIRVLGSLIEKELSTPDYYPLTLNALTNACNQKSSRHPVVSYDEETVQQAVDRLAEKGLVWKSMVGRVPKYEQRFTAARKWIARESAILCVLLLRGPQTAGEIRSRTARLYGFAHLEEVLETLTDLSERGCIARLAREPGCKESRYTHLLGAAALVAETAVPESDGEQRAAESEPAATARLDEMEHAIALLKEDLKILQASFAEFKKQFE